MEPSIVADLINLGSAGAVIIVVIIFLKSIKERDAEWRDFFTVLNQQNCLDGEKRLELTQKILELVSIVQSELKEHDEKVDARIAAASKATVDAVKHANSQTKRGSPS